MKVVPITREVWKEKYEKDVFISVFDCDPSVLENSLFDNAFLVFEETPDTPIIYATIKQMDINSVFIEFGGSFPAYRGSPKVLPAFKELCAYLMTAGVKLISLATKNDNVAMQKLALSAGFIPCGLTQNNNGLFIEYFIKSEKEK